MKLAAIILILLVLLAGTLGPQAFFVVDETQSAIVTRFGEPIRDSINSPGLYVKTPFIDTVTYFDNRRTLFDAPPDALLTEDKKRLVIDAYAIGRIVDPLLFFKTVRTPQRAVVRATDIVTSDLRREIANDLQEEIIRTSREDIMNQVRDAVRPKLEAFGVATIDVRIKRADFPGEIAASIYARMDAERKRIGDRERAEGAERDAEVRADVDRQATIIRAEAERDANIVRGCGEAQSVKIFANALERDPEFYTFQRSLEAYRTFLTQNTTVVMAVDDFGKLFEGIRQGVVSGAEAPSESSGGGGLGSDTGLDSNCAEVAARRFLSEELDVEQVALGLLGVEEVQWPDNSLGCPEEGRAYTRKAVTGFRVDFQHQDNLYEVHTDQFGAQLATCEA